MEKGALSYNEVPRGESVAQSQPRGRGFLGQIEHLNALDALTRLQAGSQFGRFPVHGFPRALSTG